MTTTAAPIISTLSALPASQPETRALSRFEAVFAKAKATANGGLILFRLGCYYAAYGEDAKVVAGILGIQIQTPSPGMVTRRAAEGGVCRKSVLLVEQRVEAIRKKEVDAAAAAKRANAEDRLETLLREFRVTAGAAITAVLAANEQYLRLVVTTNQIRAILADELPDYTRRTPIHPPGYVNFLQENSIHNWQVDLCIFGYGEFVPESSLAKRQFIKKQELEAQGRQNRNFDLSDEK